MALVASAAAVYGQGTVQFNNGITARFQLQRADGVRSNAPGSTSPQFQALNFGLFWGTTAAEVALDQTPLTPFGAMTTTPGVMNAPGGNGYAVETAQPGDRVFLQVRGWSASFGSDWRAAMLAFQANQAGVIFGETDVRQLGALGLGPLGGPGVAIWQGATGTNPNLFNPLILFEAVPEPSVIGLAIIGLGSLVFLRRRNK